MSLLTETNDLSKKKDTGFSSVRQYMSFMVEERAYAIPLSEVAEITPYRDLNQMPHMPKDVVGLLDLRGAVLPVISLRARMGLPKKDSHTSDTILILAHHDSRVGMLVDLVESVITANEEQHANLSPMLQGKDGRWVQAILLLNEKVILVLEPDALIDITQGPGPDGGLSSDQVKELDDVELRLDEGLRNLIAMAGSREDGKIIPQVRNVIAHNESEVTKLLERVETMLVSTDKTFSGLTQFKQEAAMCGLSVFDKDLAELNIISQDVQNTIFDVMQQLQFQDIVRQKLERVLTHIIGMQDVIAYGFNPSAPAAPAEGQAG
jgi:purine-binding chemotaxis protein CheW